MEFADLTPEQKDRARACKTAADLIEFAKSEGMELSDEQLENVAGGAWYCNGYCSENCYSEWIESMCPQYH